jgi:hypothetical protein
VVAAKGVNKQQWWSALSGMEVLQQCHISPHHFPKT